ncbi:LuxR C-terminal-related transcriptional regulator [Agromyces cerinus]|uniref:MerR family regulatory protein n=1 Tax=Agromyces cerinus subsp. cerinus TaxID=232089 RepID=A0A1N6HK06_9MICO|nr:LuxR C-terminal-related transcriptional regulator [Agromyces cerinus]SIO20066.1 MerR family regulatory protein [Agromyces cerinus subsp. cerinus]
MNPRFVTIGVAARESGVPIWRLRAWDASGLLTPSRTPSGYRLFSAADVERARRLAAEIDGAERLHALGLAYDVATGGDPMGAAAAASRSDAEIRTSERYGLLRQVTHHLRASDDTRSAVGFSVAQLAQFIGADAWSVALADQLRQRIEVYSTFGLSERFTDEVGPWPFRQGLGGQVYALREPISVPDLQPVVRAGREMVLAEGLRAYACVPLFHGSARVGILEMYRRTPDPFELEDLDLLEMVASLITPYIESGRLVQQVTALQQERVHHFRTLVSQFSAAGRRQREQLAAELRTITAELSATDAGSGSAGSIAARLTGLAQESEQLRSTEFDFLELVNTSVIDRIAQEHVLNCSLEVRRWPAGLSTSLASRLYLLLVRLAEEIAAIAEDHVVIRLDSSPDRIQIGLDYGTTDGPLKDPYHPSAEAGTIIDDLDAAFTAERGPASSSVTVSIPRDVVDHPGELLTQREAETLEALRSGLTNREIAARFEISAKTVQNHLTSIYRKLQVSNRSEAISVVGDAAAELR